MTRQLKRREFVKYSALTTLGLHFLPFSGVRAAPSDRVRIAHIGLGGMGLNHMNWFANLPEAEIVALCDVDELHAHEALLKLKQIHPDTKAQVYSDFRKVLDRQDIDAITIATPDHWHAQIAILAFQAGKDVYSEKPLSYSQREGKLMLNSQKETGRIFQLGTQIHAGENYHRVAEIIQSGVLGKIKTVRLWKTGEPPLIPVLNYQAPPSNLNWDMWLGPAPYSDYSPEKVHFNYRYFMEYSGGVFQDFWCHIADIVWWSISPSGLKKVRANGEKSDGAGDTPKWIDVDFKFKKLNLHWTSTPPDVAGAADRSIGAYFEGTKGTLICDYSTREIRIDGKVVEDIPEIPKSIIRSPGHQQNFIDAVKAQSQPESYLEYARNMTMPMHLALISFKLKEELKWDAKHELFKNNEVANQLLFRPYRDKWNLIGA
ncbi:Gfo/Idh/MocA family oxidoreductase [Algoriphagus sp. D3-2-R+10]|uniref:Gfo/Idh/MocA family protein n=1 Tax=Algoriphagus aurantiacus TaxID=3103948 RepID=UPI002B38B581|nr:Gfo/Idh/MocA family oxidoreductase [Algoriphagus sp. D3-2-R+10]MEB2777980.1 Gfo/Idh/MocA family oxidoreductase [Algoriphagus sp. D3-2-R+10]